MVKYNRVKDNYPKHELSWINKTITQMAEEVGLDEIYILAYDMQSDFVHSKIISLDKYVDEREDGILIDVDPKSSWPIKNEILYSCSISLDILELFDKVFDTKYLEASCLLDEFKQLSPDKRDLNK